MTADASAAPPTANAMSEPIAAFESTEGEPAGAPLDIEAFFTARRAAPVATPATLAIRSEYVSSVRVSTRGAPSPAATIAALVSGGGGAGAGGGASNLTVTDPP